MILGKMFLFVMTMAMTSTETDLPSALWARGDLEIWGPATVRAYVHLGMTNSIF